MKPEEHKQKLAEVLSNLNDQGKVADLLTQLADDYGIVIAEKTAQEIEAAKLKIDNESLRDTNMRLFLKVGAVPQPENKPDSEDQTPRRFEDLFDENGNLK